MDQQTAINIFNNVQVEFTEKRNQVLREIFHFLLPLDNLIHGAVRRSHLKRRRHLESGCVGELLEKNLEKSLEERLEERLKMNS